MKNITEKRKHCHHHRRVFRQVEAKWMTQFRYLACQEVYESLLTLINFISASRFTPSPTCSNITFVIKLLWGKTTSTRLRQLTFLNQGICTAFAFQEWREDHLQMGDAYLLWDIGAYTEDHSRRAGRVWPLWWWLDLGVCNFSTSPVLLKHPDWWSLAPGKHWLSLM